MELPAPAERQGRAGIIRDILKEFADAVTAFNPRAVDLQAPCSCSLPPNNRRLTYRCCLGYDEGERQVVPQLLLELWDRVAVFVGTKAGVRISSTCRRWAELQPGLIIICFVKGRTSGGSCTTTGERRKLSTFSQWTYRKAARWKCPGGLRPQESIGQPCVNYSNPTAIVLSVLPVQISSCKVMCIVLQIFPDEISCMTYR